MGRPSQEYVDNSIKRLEEDNVILKKTVIVINLMLPVLFNSRCTAHFSMYSTSTTGSTRIKNTSGELRVYF